MLINKESFLSLTILILKKNLYKNYINYLSIKDKLTTVSITT